MKVTLIGVVLLTWAVSQPAAAQSTCSEAYAGCQKPQDGGRCDVVCKAYCTKEKQACMKTGNFSTKNNKWNGLQKK
jgi:hypothetical protein